MYLQIEIVYFRGLHLFIIVVIMYMNNKHSCINTKEGYKMYMIVYNSNVEIIATSDIYKMSHLLFCV